MTDANPEVDELVQLLDGLTYIESHAKLGRGVDEISNAALNSIRERAAALNALVRSLEETNMFGPDELARRMSPRREGDL